MHTGAGTHTDTHVRLLSPVTELLAVGQRLPRLDQLTNFQCPQEDTGVPKLLPGPPSPLPAHLLPSPYPYPERMTRGFPTRVEGKRLIRRAPPCGQMNVPELHRLASSMVMGFRFFTPKDRVVLGTPGSFPWMKTVPHTTGASPAHSVSPEAPTTTTLGPSCTPACPPPAPCRGPQEPPEGLGGAAMSCLLPSASPDATGPALPYIAHLTQETAGRPPS